MEKETVTKLHCRNNVSRSFKYLKKATNYTQHTTETIILRSFNTSITTRLNPQFLKLEGFIYNIN